mgnify:FL=1|jgi:hypothetical protein|tara:strand:- start:881 stop:1423 length:543 start_codon:yes stop_codon:yes gene_type:complete
MAICNPIGSLTVTISENITLPNGNIENAVNSVVIKDVKQIVRRIDTISYEWENNGVEILRFVENEESQTAGSFVRDTVKYLRFTNLDTKNYLSLYLIQDSPDSYSPNTQDLGSGDEGIFKLDPGKSMILSNAQFESSNYYDYVVEGYVDMQYYSSFASLTQIKAKAHTADVQIEYLVGSS